MDSTALIPVQYGLDTFYFVICGALVMWMAAGFAMLEAGLVRAKNTAEILTKNIVLYALASIMYLLVGYYIMYSSPDGGILPSTGFLIGDENAVDVVAAGGEDAPYYSARADFFFQIVFAATCMSVVSGAVAERMKLWAFIAFAVVMTGFIYPIRASGNGAAASSTRPASSTSPVPVWCTWPVPLRPWPVSCCSGRARASTANGQINAIPGANMPLATLGAFILWMGWFGFNGGSQLKMSTIEDANAVAGLRQHQHGCRWWLIAALITARLLFGKSDLTMVLNGALAGLVAITAEPLTPSALQATLIGGVGGVLVVFSILGLDKLKLDDPVGAISVHGVAGMWNLLAVPLTNADASFGAQLLGLVSIFLWVFIASLIVWGIIKAVMGLRVSEEEEYEGVDVVECGTEAYPEFTRQ